MKILLLAAGYATRLYPLTKHWPKPLLLVKEKPILNHIIEKVDDIKESDEIIVITNDKFAHRFEEWADALNFKKRISVLNDESKSEEDRLGAIGDINFALERKNINDDLLVIGGDNLFNFDLKSFVTNSRRNKMDAVIGVYDIKDPAMVRHYGVVTLDKKNRIVGFQEKPKKSKSTLISMCIYYFSKKTLPLIKKYIEVKKCHDTSGDYIKWLSKKCTVFGYEFQGTWHDIGDIVTFYHASVTFSE